MSIRKKRTSDCASPCTSPHKLFTINAYISMFYHIIVKWNGAL